MSSFEQRLEHPAQRIINSDQNLVELCLIANEFHSDDEDYHNFGHPLDALLYAEKEIDTYERETGKILPRLKIYKGLLLHDLYEHLPLELDSKFPTKEHRTAFIAGYILREMGETEEDVTDIQRWIINTNADYPCEPDDHAGKVFCRADIGNTSDRVEVFVINFIKVYREQTKRLLRAGKAKDVVDPFVAGERSIAFLSKYFNREDLALGDWDRDTRGVCKFVARASLNFVALPEHLRQFLGDDDSIDQVAS